MTDLPRLIVRRLETAQTRTARALWHENEKVRRKALKGARRARRQALKLTAEYFGVGEPQPALYQGSYLFPGSWRVPRRADGTLATAYMTWPLLGRVYAA